MSNLEELIEMRNEAIKQQEWCLETIEKYIKENSITYYNDYINKSLSTDAKEHTLFDIAVTFNDEKDYIKHLSVSNELLRWAKEITDGKIDPNLLFKSTIFSPIYKFLTFFVASIKYFVYKCLSFSHKS